MSEHPKNCWCFMCRPENEPRQDAAVAKSELAAPTLLAAFATHDSPAQHLFILALMDVTGCRKCLGLGWIWRLVAATPDEIKRAADIAEHRRSAMSEHPKNCWCFMCRPENEPRQDAAVAKSELAAPHGSAPLLPSRVKECQGLYTRNESDLFIDDLSPSDLRMIADHLEWKTKRQNDKLTCGERSEPLGAAQCSAERNA